MRKLFRRFSKLKCDRKPIMSSIIASVGYNTSEEILEIEFKRNRDIWQYSEVPNLLWTEFVKSNSKGKFFLKEIKDKYPRVKI